MDLSLTDWIVIAIILLTLIANACTRWLAYRQDAKKNAFDRVAGMVGRVAGEVRDQLAAVAAQPGSTADIGALKAELIRRGADKVVAEMAGSLATTDGDGDKVAGMIKGELGKLPDVVTGAIGAASPAILSSVAQAAQGAAAAAVPAAAQAVARVLGQVVAVPSAGPSGAAQ